jgi:hypothetical protein
MAAGRVLIHVLLIASVPVAAQAQPGARGDAPVAAIDRPLVLAPGACQAALVVESNESARRRFEPLSLAPDVHCGITPRLTLGVTHSARALSQVDSGDGLCLRGADTGCARLYDGTAIDALVHLRGGDAAVAARARLVASSYDPFKPSLRVGALVRLRRGRAALLLDPHIAFGLASRDRGNRDQLNIPARVQVQLVSRVVLALQTGVRGEVSVFGDAFAVPVGLGVELSPARAWDIGLEAAFPRLLGPQNTFKERHVALYVTYRPAYRASSGSNAGGPPIALVQPDHATDERICTPLRDQAAVPEVTLSCDAPGQRM